MLNKQMGGYPYRGLKGFDQAYCGNIPEAVSDRELTCEASSNWTAVCPIFL
jgi:hypothetical protein